MAKLAHPNVAAVHDVGVYREQVLYPLHDPRLPDA
jgi:hypothetical protein